MEQRQQPIRIARTTRTPFTSILSTMNVYTLSRLEPEVNVIMRNRRLYTVMKEVRLILQVRNRPLDPRFIEY